MKPKQINEVLEFWFADRARDAPTIDSRMDLWFGENEAFDAELVSRFAVLTEQALTGALDDWADSAEGILALILLLEEFPRRVYKNSPKSYSGDRKALKLCEKGVASDLYRKLSPVQQLFFFMPLQRAESIKIQQTSVKIFNALADRVSSTYQDTFRTVAQFAELRRDIIAEFGRFPHRDDSLGRAAAGQADAAPAP